MSVDTPIRSIPSKKGSSREAMPICTDITSNVPERSRRSASAACTFTTSIGL
ncbi:MAG: hypothetical protein NBV67_10720 [Tagaea sp.]|nr:hypothetical protein [Tagaea sp.]